MSNPNRACKTKGCKGRLPNNAHHMQVYCAKCVPTARRERWRKQAAARYAKLRAEAIKVGESITEHRIGRAMKKKAAKKAAKKSSKRSK